MEKNRAEVIICGSNYLLSSDKSEERITEVAKYVDEEPRATSKALNVNPNFKSAVLTVLNIAEKMMDNFLMTINSYFPLWEKSSVSLNILISVKSMA